MKGRGPIGKELKRTEEVTIRSAKIHTISMKDGAFIIIGYRTPVKMLQSVCSTQKLPRSNHSSLRIGETTDDDIWIDSTHRWEITGIPKGESMGIEESGWRRGRRGRGGGTGSRGSSYPTSSPPRPPLPVGLSSEKSEHFHTIERRVYYHWCVLIGCVLMWLL